MFILVCALSFIFTYYLYCILELFLNMYIRRFISKTWLMQLWDLAWWMWNQQGRPVGWNLRQELTLLSWGRISSSSRKPQVLLFRPLTGRGHCSVEGDLLYWSSDDGWNIIHKIPSWQHLDGCLVESLETGPAKLTPELTITVPVKLFALQNPNICTVITAFCSPLGYTLKYIIFGEQCLLGKRAFLLKILTR